MFGERIGMRMWLAAALALLCGLGVGVGLSAARGGYPTDATIYYTAPDVLNGRVTSAKATCVPGRKVKVKKVRSGPDRKLATKTTDAGGLWQKRFDRPVRPGAYYSAIAEREFSTYVCSPAHSNTTTITP